MARYRVMSPQVEANIVRHQFNTRCLRPGIDLAPLIQLRWRALEGEFASIRMLLSGWGCPTRSKMNMIDTIRQCWRTMQTIPLCGPFSIWPQRRTPRTCSSRTRTKTFLLQETILERMLLLPAQAWERTRSIRKRTRWVLRLWRLGMLWMLPNWSMTWLTRSLISLRLLRIWPTSSMREGIQPSHLLVRLG